MPNPPSEVPADGTEVRLRRGMPGTFEGQLATVRHQHPTSGHSNLPRLVWLECEVLWSHGTADGFWAARSEYVVSPVDDDEDEPCGCDVRPRYCAWNGACCDRCTHDTTWETRREVTATAGLVESTDLSIDTPQETP